MAAVKAIPPQRKEPPLKKVAAYCRVSTKSQEPLDSLAAQERYYECESRVENKRNECRSNAAKKMKEQAGKGANCRGNLDSG